MTSPTIAGPTKIGGRYTVERPLGSGATATVYLCRDERTRGLVAVKVLHLELAESVGAERFLREIRLTSKLDHPSIVPVIDSGADGSRLYCVLPYLEGGTLRDLLSASRQLAYADAVRIGTTIAVALSYAHDNGLIHRDIKPENILFSQGKPYLGDFGIARVLHATADDLGKTTTGVVRGTPAYMSPEQASGERNYDGRSDIYSLGCVLYEMISGMPPFVGPTAQSVLAQRFSVTPRPMRTYRKSVSEEMEAVVEKAMALVPADRFTTPREFSDALDAAAKASPRRVIQRKHAAIAVLAATVLVAAGVLAGRSGVIGGADLKPDTTQLAVLPFERDANTDSLGSIDAFVYDAFSAWRGLTVLEPFQVRDAVARNSTVSGVARDRAVAIRLGAGRFVRGSVTSLPDGSGWRVRASLHQVKGRGDSTLFSHMINIRRAELASIDVQYAALARALLVRGVDSAGSSPVVATTSLPAMQFFTRGIAAVDEWDFPTADTLFQHAITIDPEYRRAYLWQAQVRFFQRSVPLEQWAPLAQKALVDTMRLPSRDVQLARALTALGEKEYEAACGAYETLRAKNDADFAAWFGLARCRDLDLRIVADATSPTGWRYLASYDEAVQAYQKAFQVLSLSHRSLERGAFEPLRDLLFMRPGKLQGAAPPAGINELYVGRLDWEDGKAVLRPMPYALFAVGDPSAVPAGMRTAIESQQRLFGVIAAGWSTALPNSAGAKEAVAVALEMRGDRSSLDTLHAARARATEADARLRLAAAEAVLRIKFADPSDSAELVHIRLLADSLLTEHVDPTPRQAGYLAPLATMRGDCRRAASLTSLGPALSPRGVSRDVIGAADALLVTTILGCPGDASAEIRRLRARIESSTAAPGAVNGLLLRAVQATEGRDTSLTSSFAGAGVYLLAAQRAVYQRRPDSVAAIMNRLNAARARTGYDDIGPDAIYLEARALLGIGDSASAVASLDRLFDRLPFLTPGMLNRPAEMAGLMRAMHLRGELAAAQRDARGARWGTARQLLWLSSAKARNGGTSSPTSR